MSRSLTRQVAALSYFAAYFSANVVIAERLPEPIEKGLPAPGLLAHVAVSKYADHLPIYRQEGILKRFGVALSRSTLCDWMAASAELLRPLYDLMVAQVVQSLWLHTDDTSVKNLGHEPGSTATARFWIYWGDRTHPYNVFDFTMSRSRDGPSQFLEGYRGFLQADAFGGYDGIYAGGRVIEVGCNAHARRKFVEAEKTSPALAHEAVARIRQLYAVEDEAKHLDALLRAARRRERGGVVHRYRGAAGFHC